MDSFFLGPSNGPLTEATEAEVERARVWHARCFAALLALGFSDGKSLGPQDGRMGEESGGGTARAAYSSRGA
jgi:hypothetical protein